ncbi:hypothetical protein GPECTOR_5g244 [Gonium pectorale]|uniref:SCP domain-containing protein n=1 Tax=Gonium pectorale TaxID=33097 RepID=A0A150GWH5_GONPE|nr:hypothetical protein GPECTOR_5g244 [Gonium pectorale]|eukprot:KXZ54145.1 hypothetical protein GPECTOR_5g244 [Gonium pectorale]
MCINAVRADPDILQDVPCYNSIKASLKSPKRLPLNLNGALTNVASAHNALMVSSDKLETQFPGQSDLLTRVKSAGYDVKYSSINIAWGMMSARALVAIWMCSESQRYTLFACDVVDTGIASGNKYYTQILGCAFGTTCSSCDGPGGFSIFNSTSGESSGMTPGGGGGMGPGSSPMLSPGPRPSPRPSPGPQPSPSPTPSPSPRPSPSPDNSPCSSTDGSAEAILRCIQAVRVNPDILSSVPCYANISASLKTPPRYPFTVNPALTTAALNHNNALARANLGPLFQLPGGPDLGERVQAAGYDYWVVGTTLYNAVPASNARAVVSAWLCTWSQRIFLFACDVQDIGAAAGGNYYSTVVGCQNGQLCNSCNISMSDLYGNSTDGGSGGMGGGGGAPGNSTGGSGGSMGGMYGNSTDTGPCLKNDTSAAAVLACVNAVRANPDIMKDVPCYNSIKASLVGPKRGPLQTNGALTWSAVDHNSRQIASSMVAAQLPGEPDLGSRTVAAGYPYTQVGINLAAGPLSAYHVVALWMCVDNQREFMLSCGVQDVGVASGSSSPSYPPFYTMVTGCPIGVLCDSCNGTSGGNGNGGMGGNGTGGGGSTGGGGAVVSGVCSSTNTSAAAASLRSPQRLPLAINSALMAVSEQHNRFMAANNIVGPPNQTVFGAYLQAQNYIFSYATLNLWWGSLAARQVVTEYLCQDGMRANMFACGINEFGGAMDFNPSYGRFFTNAPKMSPPPRGAKSPPPLVSLPPAPPEGSLTWYDIRPVDLLSTTMCMGGNAPTGNNIAVVLQQCSKAAAQKFRLSIIDGYWNVIDSLGRCLTVTGRQGMVTVGSCDLTSSSVQFSTEAVAGQPNVFRLRSKLSSKCVGLQAGAMAGSGFVQVNCVGPNYQNLLLARF